MIKVSIHQEDKIILNVHITINIFQNAYILTKLKRIEKFTNIHTDGETPLSVTNFFKKQQNSLRIQEISTSLSDIYRTLHQSLRDTYSLQEAMAS